MLDLKNRNAIFAGTKRVGEEVVLRLAEEGIRPAIIYRRSRDEAQALLEKATKLAGGGCLVQADLSMEADVKRSIEEARSQLGDISFCINLAADYPRIRFDDLDAAAWDQGMAIARASFLLALHASRAMMDNKGETKGHIILFGDWAAEATPYTEYLPYLSAKAAIHFLTRGLALELARHRILVNGILPGPTARPADMSDALWDTALRQAPLHRESSSTDIAGMIATLLKMETITGETIRVDSGRHIVGSGMPTDVEA